MFTYFFGGSGVDLDVLAHWNAMTSTDPGQRKDVRELIEGLKEDNIWSKIDVLSVVHDNKADSLLNLRGTSINANSEEFGSPAFTIDRGFKMTNDNITRFGIGASQANSMTVYNSHAMVYTRGQQTSSFDYAFLMHFDDGSSMFLKSYLDAGSQVELGGKIGRHGEHFKQWTSGLPTMQGFSLLSQDTSDIIVRLNDFSEQQFGGWDSPTFSTDKIAVGAQYDTGGTYDYDVAAIQTGIQYAAWGLGFFLTDIETGKYEDRIRTYMQARGADVY